MCWNMPYYRQKVSYLPHICIGRDMIGFFIWNTSTSTFEFSDFYHSALFILADFEIDPMTRTTQSTHSNFRLSPSRRTNVLMPFDMVSTEKRHMTSRVEANASLLQFFFRNKISEEKDKEHATTQRQRHSSFWNERIRNLNGSGGLRPRFIFRAIHVTSDKSAVSTKKKNSFSRRKA